MTSPEITDIVNDATAVEETYFETIQRLAALPTHEYERCRKAEAKRLEMRTSVLDNEVKSARPKDEKGNDLGLFDPEPWPEKVDGDDLLDRIVAGLRQYVVMPPHAAEAVALWCVHAHVFEAWQHTPRLAIGAPEKGCGKSLLLDVISQIVPRALQTDSLSEAVAFRLAESHKPVFLIDECDAHLASKNPDDGLRGILNSGHAKGKRALRCIGDDHEVKGFNTFTPVVLAGIGSLPPTLADRSIRIILHRRKADEPVQDFRSDRAGHLHDLASQAARWTADHKKELLRLDPTMPGSLFNRRADVWRPLVAIAEVAGGGWPERVWAAAAALEGSAADETESITVILFGDIRATFEKCGDDKIPSAKLAEYLNDMEDRPWPEYGRSRKPITTVQIARLLKRHMISPNTIRMGDKTPKGYHLDQFKNAFARYLLPSEPQHRHNPQKTAENWSFQGATLGPDVADLNPPKPAVTLGCGGVSAGNGISGDKQEKKPWRERL
jgi:putative DNA primase/helicase